MDEGDLVRFKTWVNKSSLRCQS